MRITITAENAEERARIGGDDVTVDHLVVYAVCGLHCPGGLPPTPFTYVQANRAESGRVIRSGILAELKRAEEVVREIPDEEASGDAGDPQNA